MKVIFLDFDGVLNSWRFFKDQTDKRPRSLLWPDRHIDPKAVKNLNEIVRLSGARVVVSSTWRLGHTLKELQAALDRAGFKGVLIDKTPCLDTERGHEIDKWLQSNPAPSVDSFVILDDNDDMVHLMPYLVLIDARKGLKSKNVDAAVAHLNRNDPAPA